MDVDSESITLMDTETEAQMTTDMMSLAVGVDTDNVSQDPFSNMMENTDDLSDAAGLASDMAEIDKTVASTFVDNNITESNAIFPSCDKLTPGTINYDCFQMADCSEMVSEKQSTVVYGSISRFSKQILCEGNGLIRPQDGAKCLLSLFVSNSVSDITESAKCLGYPLGTDIEIEIGEAYSIQTEQIDLCLSTMKEGEICETKIYDHSNEETMITKPSEVLNIQIHLKSFKNSIPIWQLSPEDKFSLAHHNKSKGTEYFRSGNIEYAFKRFSKALKYLICMFPEENIPETLFDDYCDLRANCYMNLAACQMKSRRYDFVITNCSNALTINPNKVKALYRRAQAFLHLNDLDSAKSDLTLAAKLDPRNKAVIQLQHQVQSRQAEQDTKMADSMSKMFSS